jgi:hypothetical protein
MAFYDTQWFSSGVFRNLALRFVAKFRSKKIWTILCSENPAILCGKNVAANA